MPDRPWAEQEPPEPTPEEWIYGGIRIAQGGAKAHAWLPVGQDPDVELLYPAKRSAALDGAVGSVYTVRVVRHDNGRITKYADHTYLRRHDDADVRARLETRHRLATVELDRRRMEASDKRVSELDAVLAPLLEVAARVGPFDRDAFTVMVLARLNRTWGRK